MIGESDRTKRRTGNVEIYISYWRTTDEYFLVVPYDS